MNETRNVATDNKFNPVLNQESELEDFVSFDRVTQTQMDSAKNAAATATGAAAAPAIQRQNTETSGSKLRYTHRDRNTVLT